MMSEDNLDTAYRMATNDGSKHPSDADLRAAINRVYYALFRALRVFRKCHDRNDRKCFQP